MTLKNESSGQQFGAMDSLIERLAQHAPSGHLDAMRATLSGSGEALAPHWQTFFENAVGSDDLITQVERFNELNESLLRRVADNGVTYNLYSDSSSQPRPWSVDLLPMILDQTEWSYIERGVAQRARLLNSLLSDVYGDQKTIKRGLLPAALVAGHQGYMRAVHGVRPRENTFLHVAAFDLACGPDHQWWVMSQRLQAPSGLGYMLENRMIVSRLFPDAFRTLQVERVVGAYRSLIASLMAHSPAGADARVVLLTPGPYSETYFEHVYLARYLGMTLVEGGDLVVRNERVGLKTLKGLEPVDIIMRRLDDDFSDPLELRADSALGVPGLMQAYRAGNVVLANAPGTSFLESTAILGFLPRLCEALLTEKLVMPSIPSWWCGERAAMRAILPQLSEHVIKPTFNDKPRRFVPTMGKHLSAREREQWMGRIAMRPEHFTAQAYLPLAYSPSWQGASSPTLPIASRATMVRVFALSDGAGNWSVAPGGLARIAPAGRDIVSMYRGGSSADVWAITGRGRADTTPLSNTLTPISTGRATMGIASRAAENLYWFGRYTERLDNTTRLARITLEALASNDEELPSTQSWLSKLSVSHGLVSEETPTISQSAVVFERTLMASLSDRAGKLGCFSVAATLGALQSTAFSVRERLALEQWTLVATSATEFAAATANTAQGETVSRQQALRALQQLSTQIMAMTGAQADRMTRDDGWRLLSIGRQIERTSTLAEALAEAFTTGTLTNDTGFGLVLGFFDSTITYRARYQQQRDPKALMTLLALDSDNPRSLAWITQTLQARIAKLEGLPRDTLPLLLQKRSLPHQWDVDHFAAAIEKYAQGDATEIVSMLEAVVNDANEISDALSQRYFTHATGARVVGS
jgi:uncharacterized circularly permuted ATP-grasp superfamily protein/uncharacterized alpha-E superfamily protein